MLARCSSVAVPTIGDLVNELEIEVCAPSA